MLENLQTQDLTSYDRRILKITENLTIRSLNAVPHHKGHFFFKHQLPLKLTLIALEGDRVSDVSAIYFLWKCS